MNANMMVSGVHGTFDQPTFVKRSDPMLAAEARPQAAPVFRLVQTKRQGNFTSGRQRR
jgi:hypothetical protein